MCSSLALLIFDSVIPIIVQPTVFRVDNVWSFWESDVFNRIIILSRQFNIQRSNNAQFVFTVYVNFTDKCANVIDLRIGLSKTLVYNKQDDREKHDDRVLRKKKINYRDAFFR